MRNWSDITPTTTFRDIFSVQRTDDDEEATEIEDLNYGLVIGDFESGEQLQIPVPDNLNEPVLKIVAGHWSEKRTQVPRISGFKVVPTTSKHYKHAHPLERFFASVEFVETKECKSDDGRASALTVDPYGWLDRFNDSTTTSTPNIVNMSARMFIERSGSSAEDENNKFNTANTSLSYLKFHFLKLMLTKKQFHANMLPGYSLKREAVHAAINVITNRLNTLNIKVGLDHDGVSNRYSLSPAKTQSAVSISFFHAHPLEVSIPEKARELGLLGCPSNKIPQVMHALLKHTTSDQCFIFIDDSYTILSALHQFFTQHSGLFIGSLYLFITDAATGALMPFDPLEKYAPLLKNTYDSKRLPEKNKTALASTSALRETALTCDTDFLSTYFAPIPESPTTATIFPSQGDNDTEWADKDRVVTFYPLRKVKEDITLPHLEDAHHLMALMDLHYSSVGIQFVKNCLDKQIKSVNCISGGCKQDALLENTEQQVLLSMLTLVLQNLSNSHEAFHQEVIDAHTRARNGKPATDDTGPNSIILASVLASFVHKKPMGECLSLFLTHFSAENALSHLPETVSVQSTQPKTSRASYRSKKSLSSSHDHREHKMSELFTHSSLEASESDAQPGRLFEITCEEVAAEFRQDLNEGGILEFLDLLGANENVLNGILKTSNEPSLVSSIFRIRNELRFANHFPERDFSDLRKFDGVSYFIHPQIAEPVTVVNFDVPLEIVGQFALRYQSHQNKSEISVLVPQKVSGKTPSISAKISSSSFASSTQPQMKFKFFDIESTLIRLHGEAAGSVTFKSLPFRKDAVNRLITAAPVNSLFVGKKVFNQKIGKECFQTKETFSKDNHLVLPGKFFLQCRALQLFIDFCLGADRENKATKDYFTNFANELGLEGDEASKFLNAQRYWLTALQGLLFSVVICPNGLLPELVVKLMHRMATASSSTALTSARAYRTQIVHFPREGQPWGLKYLSAGKPIREIFPELFISSGASFSSEHVVVIEKSLVRSTDRDDFLGRVWTPGVEAALAPYVFLNYDSSEKFKFSTSHDLLIKFLYDLAEEASKEFFNQGNFTEMLLLYVTLVQLPCKAQSGEQADLQAIFKRIVTEKTIASLDFKNLDTKLSLAITQFTQLYTKNEHSILIRALTSLSGAMQGEFFNFDPTTVYPAKENALMSAHPLEVTIVPNFREGACLQFLGDLVRLLGGRREYDENDSFWNQYKFNLAMLPVTLSAIMAAVMRMMDVTEHKNQTQFFSNASTTATILSPDQELEISIFMVGLTGYLVLQFLERLMSAQDRVGFDPKPWNLFFGSVTIAAMIGAGVYGQVGDPDNRAVEFSGDVSLGLLASSLVANGVDVLTMLAPYVSWPFVTPYIQARLGCKKDDTSDHKRVLVESILREFNRWVVTMGTVAAYGVAPLWALTLLVNVLYDFGASLEGKNNATSFAIRAIADGISEFSILSALVGSYAVLNYQIKRDLVLPNVLKAVLALGSVFVALSALNEGAYFSYFVASAVMTNTTIPDWIAFIEEDLKEPIDITCVLLAVVLATAAYHVAYQNSEKNNPAKSRLPTQDPAICCHKKTSSSNNKASLHGRQTPASADTPLLADPEQTGSSYAT